LFRAAKTETKGTSSIGHSPPETTCLLVGSTT